MKKKFNYGAIYSKQAEMFRLDLHKNLGIKKQFSSRNVLEIGCGYGFDAKDFCAYAKSVVGLDYEAHPTWAEYKNKKLKFVKSVSEKLPFKNNSFDAIFLKDVLHHVENVDKSLEEIKRVSSKGAKIIILEGNRFNPVFYVYATKIRGHEHFSQNEFKKIILKHFSNATFKHIEAYPPFFLNDKLFKVVIGIEKVINKISILAPFFSYNAAFVELEKK